MAAVSSSTPPKSSEEMKNLKITESTKSEEKEAVVTGSAEKSENEAESPSSSSSSSTKSEKKKRKKKNKKNKKKKMIILKSADGKEFEVEESIVLISETIKHLIEDGCDGNEVPIPLPNVTSDVLEKVIEFLKKHGPAMEYLYKPGGKIVKDEIDEEEFDKVVAKLMEFDKEFIDGLESDQVLFDLIFAANYLAIRNLMECTCQVVASKLREMTPEQVRAYLRIENDYSPEQEAKVRADNAWAFQ
ncbi:hypothetical protein MKW98_023230 [Papaver atlanticum]|uniref:SKP1-like protein n=1 Tax=Papaver atlanticum TaxID=357466 RepID=A0AAD4T9T1_9MAGN|nr:hypothetical protein MKW98_023230 [Papaver atlanticum]